MGPDDIYVLFPVQKLRHARLRAGEDGCAACDWALKVADSVFAQASCLNPLNKTGRRPLELPRYVGEISLASEKDPALKGQKDPAIGVLADLGLVAGDSIPYALLRKRTDRLVAVVADRGGVALPIGHGRQRHRSRRWCGRRRASTPRAAWRTTTSWAARRGSARVLPQPASGSDSKRAPGIQLGGLRDEAVLGMRKNLRYRWHILAPALTLNGGLERIPVYTEDGTRAPVDRHARPDRLRRCGANAGRRMDPWRSAP